MRLSVLVRAPKPSGPMADALLEQLMRKDAMGWEGHRGAGMGTRTAGPAPSRAAAMASAASRAEQMTQSLDLGLDFGAMDFKKIAANTRRVVALEHRGGSTVSAPSAPTPAGEGPRRSSPTGPSSGSPSSTASHGSWVPRPANQGGLLDRIRDLRVAGDWGGALTVYSDAVSSPSAFRKWHVQHVKMLLEMLAFSGRIEPLWKVWRLSRAMAKLDDLAPQAGNHLMQRLTRPSALHAAAADPQSARWWAEVVRELRAVLRDGGHDIDAANVAFVDMAEADDPQAAILASIREADAARPQRQAARQAFHQHVAAIAGEAPPSEPAVSAVPPPPADPHTVGELNDGLRLATTEAEVERLLALAAERAIAPDDGTFAARMHRLGLRRKASANADTSDLWQEALALFAGANAAAGRHYVTGLTLDEAAAPPDLPLPSTHVCNALLYELRRAQRVHEVEAVERLMRGPPDAAEWRIAPSSKTADHLLSTYFRDGQYARCTALFNEMKQCYAARLSPLVYTLMVRIHASQTAPSFDDKGQRIEAKDAAAMGISRRTAAMRAHEETTRLIHEMAGDGAVGRLSDNANIALINAWSSTRYRSK